MAKTIIERLEERRRKIKVSMGKDITALKGIARQADKALTTAGKRRAELEDDAAANPEDTKKAKAAEDMGMAQQTAYVTGEFCRSTIAAYSDKE